MGRAEGLFRVFTRRPRTPEEEAVAKEMLKRKTPGSTVGFTQYTPGGPWRPRVTYVDPGPGGEGQLP